MKKQIYIILTILILILVGAFFIGKKENVPGKYDSFASCLKESGAIFYGAFWCPHCRDQKNLFGSSAKLIPYTECSTPDGQGQLLVCKDKNISSYPTWVFADGERLNGTVELSVLAEKTGCNLSIE